MIKKSKKLEKNLDQLFNSFDIHCSPWTASKKEAKALDLKYPQCNVPIFFQWSCKGKGFGEFVFYVKNGKIYCGNEMMDKKFIKKMLCKMVDDSILEDK